MEKLMVLQEPCRNKAPIEDGEVFTLPRYITNWYSSSFPFKHPCFEPYGLILKNKPSNYNRPSQDSRFKFPNVSKTMPFPKSKILNAMTIFFPSTKKNSWWFQPIWNILVNSQIGNLPQIRVNIRNICELPPPRKPFTLEGENVHHGPPQSPFFFFKEGGLSKDRNHLSVSAKAKR